MDCHKKGKIYFPAGFIIQFLQLDLSFYSLQPLLSIGYSGSCKREDCSFYTPSPYHTLVVNSGFNVFLSNITKGGIVVPFAHTQANTVACPFVSPDIELTFLDPLLATTFALLGHRSIPLSSQLKNTTWVNC